jgi:predicted dehydrogenase
MAEAIRASGITFAMGYNNRFNSGLQRLKAILDEGQIGPVGYARAFLTAQAQDPTGWRGHSKQSRYGALSAVGTHLIDLWRWYFGEPASRSGRLRRGDPAAARTSCHADGRRAKCLHPPAGRR